MLMVGSGPVVTKKGQTPMSQVLSAPRASDATGRIPLLDIGPYLAGVPGARADLARAIERTCHCEKSCP
jgi:hypothetical protein